MYLFSNQIAMNAVIGGMIGIGTTLVTFDPKLGVIVGIISFLAITLLTTLSNSLGLFLPSEAQNFYLYHGSITGGREILEPTKRSTPGNENSRACIYASIDPAFSAVQVFPWSSSEEVIDLYYADDDNHKGKKCVHLGISEDFFDRLKQPVYIYKVNSKSFSRVETEKVGKTYRSFESVKCLSVQKFDTVFEAVQKLGGKVIMFYS